MFSCVVDRPFGWLDLALAWCRDEIHAEWRWSLVEASSYSTNGIYRFYFSNLQDLVAFTLFR